jgi:inner membrane protein YidH
MQILSSRGLQRVAPSAMDLALDRTHMAYERTLMAWIRTAASLIGFGFTIYKFFEYLRESSGGQSERFFGVREFAFSMIVIGVVAALLATLQHWHRTKSIRLRFGYDLPHSLALTLAGLISGFGILALFVVFFRK